MSFLQCTPWIAVRPIAKFNFLSINDKYTKIIYIIIKIKVTTFNKIINVTKLYAATNDAELSDSTWLYISK